MSAFVLACLAYLFIALPGSTLGQLWPSIRLSLGVPVGALGILLAFGVAATSLSPASPPGASCPRAHPVQRRCGPVLAVGTALAAVALAAEALAPALWVFAVGMVVFGLGFGAIDSALNAYAAARFGARDINWMHASYGLGATIGPLLVTALLGVGPLGAGLTWRWPYAMMAAALAAVALVLALTRRRWQALAPAAADPPNQVVAGGPTVPAGTRRGYPPAVGRGPWHRIGRTADRRPCTVDHARRRWAAVGGQGALRAGLCRGGDRDRVGGRDLGLPLPRPPGGGCRTRSRGWPSRRTGR